MEHLVNRRRIGFESIFKSKVFETIFLAFLFISGLYFTRKYHKLIQLTEKGKEGNGILYLSYILYAIVWTVYYCFYYNSSGYHSTHRVSTSTSVRSPMGWPKRMSTPFKGLYRGFKRSLSRSPKKRQTSGQSMRGSDNRTINYSKRRTAITDLQRLVEQRGYGQPNSEYRGHNQHRPEHRQSASVRYGMGSQSDKNLKQQMTRDSHYSAESPDYPMYSSESRQQFSRTTGPSLSGSAIGMVSEQNISNTPFGSQSSGSLRTGQSHSSSTGSRRLSKQFSNPSRSSSSSSIGSSSPSIGSEYFQAPTHSSVSSNSDSNQSFQTSKSSSIRSKSPSLSFSYKSE